MGFFSWFKKKEKFRPTVGLALGSGGAKGMAHLGALKAFEENGINFDVVAGSSIGAIVGALYANGYSVADMWSIIENLNRKEFARNLRPFSDLYFAEQILSEYLEGDVSDLKKPFACWATDESTNEGVLLDGGKTAHIVTASAAIPPFFRSVAVGDRRLYDGCFSNAVPAEACRNMGAHIVVGCDLSAFSRPDEERSAVTRFLGNAVNTAVNTLMPVHTLPNAKSRGYEHSDIMLRPNLSKFHAADVSVEAMYKMYDIGYEEALARMDDIKKTVAAATK